MTREEMVRVVGEMVEEMDRSRAKAKALVRWLKGAAPRRDGVGEPEVGTGGAGTDLSVGVESEESKGGK